MQATIDEKTAALVERDRQRYGTGYLRVNAEGRFEHVPAADVVIAPVDDREPHVGRGLARRTWE